MTHEEDEDNNPDASAKYGKFPNFKNHNKKCNSTSEDEEGVAEMPTNDDTLNNNRSSVEGGKKQKNNQKNKVKELSKHKNAKHKLYLEIAPKIHSEKFSSANERGLDSVEANLVRTKN